MIKFFLTVSIIILSEFIAQAQTVIVGFGPSINSRLSSTVTGTPILGPFKTDSDIENGLITDAVNFAIKSNRLWKLATSISNIVGTANTGGPATITAPLQPLHISWGVINGVGGTVTSWTAFTNATIKTTASIEANTGARGAPAVSGNTFTLRYKVVPGFAVDPGTYAVDVTYTVSTL